MEKHSIEKAATEMKGGKKLPADSKMQKTVEQAKETGRTKKTLKVVEPLPKPHCVTLD
jgi:hypothetical protein